MTLHNLLLKKAEEHCNKLIIPALYYQSCVETIVKSYLICWHGSVSVNGKKLLSNIFKVLKL